MGWRVALLLLVGLCDLALFGRMMWGHGGIIEYRDLKQEYARIQGQIAELDARNMTLSREIRLLRTDRKYAEKMVRQKLRYLRDNEIVYLFPDNADNGETANDGKN